MTALTLKYRTIKLPLPFFFSFFDSWTYLTITGGLVLLTYLYLKALKSRPVCKKGINAIMLPSQNFVIKYISQEITRLPVINIPA